MVHWNNCFAKANLSLCGCGFLCIYHAGVCAALRVYAPQLTRNKIYGASAGSIAAAGLICNVSIADATAAILQVVAEARSGVLQAFSPTFDLMGIVRDELNRVLPEDAHQLCTDRLFISLTRYEDGKNAIISEFSTKKELIQAILCSCFIPLFCGYTVPEFRGVKYIDGGFSDNQPTFDQNTITISPFSGESDICPMDHASASILGFVYYNTSIRFNNENFYRFCSCFVPPTQEICSKICRQGFTDALRFLTKNSITPCHRCLSTQSSESLYLPETKQSINYFNNMESNFPGDQRQQQPPFRKRKRLDSECEVCLNRLEQRLSTEMTTALFPEILHKTLQEPVNTSNFASQLFNYACSFRIVRFWLGFFDPLIRYTEFALFVLKVLNDWLRKTPKRDFFMTRLQNFVDVLLNEVEERNLLCSSPSLSPQTQQFRVNRKDKSASTEFCYPIGDFDSFESLKDNSLLHDLMVLDFYMAKLPPPSKKAKNCPSPPNLLLNLPLPNPRSPTEKQQTLAPKAASRNVLALKQPSEKFIRNESNGNDSGISSSGFNSSTPAALSAVSSDDGIKKVKKRDVALSPVRNLISSIPRPKFGSRRHTVGVNSGNLAAAQAVGANSSGSAASIRRCSTQSLNKSVHSTHSLGGSKHSLMSGGSQGAASSGGQHKLRQQKQQQPAAPFLASSSSDGGEGGANADDDGEQFFVPNRMASNVGGGNGGRQQRRVSDAEYDGDADPST